MPDSVVESPVYVWSVTGVYKRQFERASRSPSDDPSVFAIELETLARRAFTDVNASVRLQLVRDRLIAGQAECSLH